MGLIHEIKNANNSRDTATLNQGMYNHSTDFYICSILQLYV